MIHLLQFILLRFRRLLLTKIKYCKIYDYWNKCIVTCHISTTPLIWDTEPCRYYDRNHYLVCKCGSLHNQRAISSSRAALHSWAADPWPSDPGLRSAATWHTCRLQYLLSRGPQVRHWYWILMVKIQYSEKAFSTSSTGDSCLYSVMTEDTWWPGQCGCPGWPHHR